jgi:lipid-binding SYLF domain-containing protein
MNRRQLIAAVAALAMLTVAGGAAPARAESRDVIDTRVRAALDELYRKSPDTRQLAERARGVLVMPHVLKGGFILGGSYGEGALLLTGPQGLQQAPAAGYYSIAAASLGLQAGIQKSSHALFFMTDGALEGFRRNDGWEIGADAEVTFPDQGVTAQTNSTLLNKPIVGIVFGQDGLLLGASLEGAKYSAIAR